MGKVETRDVLGRPAPECRPEFELRASDIQLADDDLPKLGVFRYTRLIPNLRIGALFNTEGEALCEEQQADLRDFMQAHLRHPFYIGRCAEEDCGLIILDKDDIQTFLKQYPKWEEDKFASQRNRATLNKWMNRNTLPKGSALEHYSLR